MADVANYPITGPPRPKPATSNGVPIRLEIRDLHKDADAWNLFILGLQSLYNVDVKDDLGWYEIAGIHGRPNREWGGVRGTAHTEKKSTWGGYCTHTSILFTSWHRPYLSLLEQVLFEHINKIAASFPTESRARYQKCASTWRFPYWDWAKQPPSGETNLPTFIGSEKTISVITPTSNGKSVEIPNPLYSYKFKQLNPVAGDFVEFKVDGKPVPFDKWPQTLRYPKPDISDVNATSNDEEVFKAMANEFQSLRASIILLMNDPNYKDYPSFTNHVYDPNAKDNGGKYSSIEDVHNNIHVLVGGNEGHMAEFDYASFDCAFWLHHSNIDRLFAIWQGLNPTSYTINKPAGDGTYVMASAETYTNTTPLTPFYDPTGIHHWTSDGVHDTLNLNYAYPETQKWNYSSEAEYQADLHKAVQNLYGGSIADLLASQTPKTNIPAAQQGQGQGQTGPITPIGGGNTGPITPIGGNKGNTGPIMPIGGAPECIHPISGLLGGARGSGVDSVIKSLIGDDSPFSFGAHIDSHGAGAHVGGVGVDLSIGSNPLQNVLGKAKDVITGGHTTTGASSGSTNTGSNTSGSATTAKGYTEYIANIKVLKHSVHQSFRVHVFLGKITAHNTDWHSDPALAGSVAIFGKDPEETGCDKCIQDAHKEITITGTVPLTQGLLQIWKSSSNTTLRSLRKEDVIPWLKTNLHWRITLGDGTEYDREQVGGLKVSVVTTEVSVPDKGFPVYSGVYEVHSTCTDGRPGGFCSDDII